MPKTTLKTIRQFKRMHDEFFYSAIKYSYAITHDLEISESIVTEVFVEIWNEQDYQENEYSKFKDNLFKIIKTKSFNHIKDNNIQDKYLSRETEAFLFSNQYSKISNTDLKKEINKQISMLETPTKQIVCDFFVNNISIKKICETRKIKPKLVLNIIEEIGFELNKIIDTKIFL
ncbi:MAG: hypothetical protein N4A49_10505 [Marinifilaceae bacterium]|jgi:DNA-directed RNA polymerase specialized sigma24 family protein|nr:hypothetical protein [Marinifilaceae bacterium]